MFCRLAAQVPHVMNAPNRHSSKVSSEGVLRFRASSSPRSVICLQPPHQASWCDGSHDLLVDLVRFGN